MFLSTYNNLLFIDCVMVELSHVPIHTEIRAIKKPLLSGSFNFGAGSIRAYPHAENTGLVISDIAKVQQFSFPARVFGKIFNHICFKSSAAQMKTFLRKMGFFILFYKFTTPSP